MFSPYPLSVTAVELSRNSASITAPLLGFVDEQTCYEELSYANISHCYRDIRYHQLLGEFAKFRKAVHKDLRTFLIICG